MVKPFLEFLLFLGGWSHRLKFRFEFQFWFFFPCYVSYFSVIIFEQYFFQLKLAGLFPSEIERMTVNLDEGHHCPSLPILSRELLVGPSVSQSQKFVIWGQSHFHCVEASVMLKASLQTNSCRKWSLTMILLNNHHCLTTQILSSRSEISECLQ